MPAYQIQQREQINPDDIDQVPIQASIFYGRKVGGRVMAFPRQNSQHAKKPAANDHVQRMHASHREIERKKQFRFLRVDRDLLAVVVELVSEVKGRSRDVMLLEFFRV